MHQSHDILVCAKLGILKLQESTRILSGFPLGTNAPGFAHHRTPTECDLNIATWLHF